LLRQAQERRAVEERVEEERAALIQARSAHKARMAEIEEERFHLLHEQVEQERRREAMRTAFEAQSEEARMAAWLEEDRLRKRRQEVVGSQRLLLQELQAVLRRTEALEKEDLQRQLHTPPYYRAALGKSIEGRSRTCSPECSPDSRLRRSLPTSPRGASTQRAPCVEKVRGERPKTGEKARPVDAYVRHMLAFSRRARLSEFGGSSSLPAQAAGGGMPRP